MIWFGVIIAMNLQTSFLTPPFGFALFYLRSVAAKFDYKDRVTGKLIPSVKTSEIYKGSIAFICLQLTMLVMVIVFPVLVTGGIEKTVTLSNEEIMKQLEGPSATQLSAPTDVKPESKTDDPMKDLLDSMAKEAKDKK